MAAASWQATGELIGGLAAVSDADLLDPARHPWLRGRMLSLQVIVRGFWHPAGHLGEYYLAHGRARPGGFGSDARGGDGRRTGRARRCPRHGLYNLACVQARAGPAEALAALTEAVALNPDVRANAGRDPDLAGLRDSGQLAAVLA